MRKIREAEQKDLVALKEMTDAAIGLDYYTIEDFEDILKKKRYYIYVCADEQDHPMAYLYFFSESMEHARESLHIPKGMLEEIPKDAKVGVYKTTCTDLAYRRSGVLTDFLQTLEHVLAEDGDEMILFTALELSDGRVPVDTVVRSVGFLPVCNLEHPWIKIKSYCPYCKNMFCTCNAVIYTKKLEGYNDYGEKDKK